MRKWSLNKVEPQNQWVAKIRIHTQVYLLFFHETQYELFTNPKQLYQFAMLPEMQK